MVRELIPPRDPRIEEVHPPAIFIREDLTWEYKQLSRDLDKEQILNEDELNKLGAEGWVLATSVMVDSVVYFYFYKPKN